MEQVYNYTQNDSRVETIFRNYVDDIQQKAIELKSRAEGQSSTELTDAKDYDIQDNKLGSKLKDKALKLRDEAKFLHDKAEKLASAGGELATLQTPAGKLKNAAGSSSGSDGLYHAAHQLADHSGSAGLEGKATTVIEKFDAVKGHYEALMKAAKGINQETHQLVTAVDNEYKDLEKIYDGMFNLTKLYKAAEVLKSTAETAGVGTLSSAANQLVSKVTNLRDTPTTDGKDSSKAQKVKSQFEKVQNSYDSLNDKSEKPKVKNEFDALNTAYSHIIIHYPKTLQKAAGTSSDDSDKLLGLAKDLYNKANDLNEAVKKAGTGNDTTGNSAKVLKAKTGASEKDEGTLRFLAKKLQDAASKVVKALKSAGAAHTDPKLGAAQLLEFVIGYCENGKGLRKALKDLYDVGALAGPNLTNKARGVRINYGIVQKKFQAVEKQNDAKKYDNYQPQYNAVVAAWDAFNAVYKPEELLKDAVGENESGGTFREKLKNLGEHDGSDPGKLPALVKAVKTQYGGNWGDDVKGRFHLVQAQANAYKVGNKTSDYEGLLDAWTNFNDKYYKVISYYKYHIIIVSSIITQWSDSSGKTKYVFHKVGDPKNGFGGWRPYPEHKANSGGSGCDSNEPLVHAWIWHFFDILIVTKISLAIIFIYSLHYRDSNLSRSIINQPKCPLFLVLCSISIMEIIEVIGDIIDRGS